MRIQDLDKDLLLVAGDLETRAIDEALGVVTNETHGYFLDVIDGEYARVYLYRGFVPYLEKEVEQIRP
jgi:hypothetical protein